MKGKEKTLRTLRGEYVRELDRMILELQIGIREIQRAKKNIIESCQSQPGMNSLDYSTEKVKGGNVQLSFQEAMSRIDGLQRNMNRLMDEKKELKKKRRDFIKEFQKDAEYSSDAGVFYWREIKGLSQEETAKKIGYSVRQVQRIERKIREEWGE